MEILFLSKEKSHAFEFYFFYKKEYWLFALKNNGTITNPIYKSFQHEVIFILTTCGQQRHKHTHWQRLKLKCKEIICLKISIVHLNIVTSYWTLQTPLCMTLKKCKIIYLKLNREFLRMLGNEGKLPFGFHPFLLKVICWKINNVY